MEYNTLNLYFKSNLFDLPNSIKSIKTFCITKIHNNANIYFENIKMEDLYNDKFNINTDFFYSDKIEYKVRLLLYAEYNNLDIDEKWFVFNILFDTENLAEDEKNNDFFMSDYKYSLKSKKLIRKLSKDLFKLFNNSYVIFENEYQSAFNLSETKGMLYLIIDTDFEYALLPNDCIMEISNQDTIIEEKNSNKIILCHKRFTNEK